MLRNPHQRYMLQPSALRRVTVICLLFLHIADIGRKFSIFALGKQVPPETELAFRFLDNFLQPTTGCHGKDYMINKIGVDSDFNGGFASQFQMTAAIWLRMAAATNYTIPVIIQGPIVKYTTVPQCDHVKGDITCIFLPMSSCQNEYLSSGKALPPSDGGVADIDISMVPIQFVHMGLTWWWGIVQARMFRLQPHLQKHVEEEIAHMKTVTHHGFPFGAPVAGLHVRHGDKSIDGFKDHSFNSELRAIHKSPECTYIEDNKCMTTVSPPTSATTPNVSAKATGGVPIHIFVSSDDANVLIAARKMGFLVDRSGVSQNTAKEGMVAALLRSPDMGYNATLEIVTDIYFLSHCTTLVGVAASQIYRMALDISTAKGLLRAGIIMDHTQLHKVRGLSKKYHVPMPEDFIDSAGP